MGRNHYFVLGLSKDASFQEITEAYGRLSEEASKNADPEAALRELDDAYFVLSSPLRRNAFDSILRMEERHPAFRAEASKYDPKHIGISTVESLAAIGDPESLWKLLTISQALRHQGDVRLVAGLAAVRGYARDSSSSMLFDIARDDSMPLAVRIEAGKHAIRLFAAECPETCNPLLLRMAMRTGHGDAPDEVRIIAGLNASEQLEKCGYASRLALIASDPSGRFPYPVSGDAMKRLKSSGAHQDAALGLARKLHDPESLSKYRRFLSNQKCGPTAPFAMMARNGARG